jgi:hypothetical protein
MNFTRNNNGVMPAKAGTQYSANAPWRTHGASWKDRRLLDARFRGHDSR